MKKPALLILSLIILCTACAAQAAENGLPAYASIRDALDSTDCYAEIRDNEDSVVLILCMEDRYIRIITLPDDYAKALYRAAEAKDFSRPAMEAFDAYAWKLTPAVIEELPGTPKSQAELDGLIGKSVRDLINEGFGEEILVSEGGWENPTHIELEYGLFRYAFEVTVPSDDLKEMMVLRAEYSGLSRAAFAADIQEH